MAPGTNPPPGGRGAVQRTREERDALVVAHEDYVRALAVKFVNQFRLRVEASELAQLGMIGLIEAAERWDPEGGASFSAYAYFRIKGAILDGIGDLTGVTRSQIRSLRGAYRSQSYQESLAETARADANPEEAAAFVANAIRGVTFVSEFADLVESTPAEDLTESSLTTRADTRIQRRQVRAHVHEVLEAMDERERWLLTEHYVRGRTLTELGEEIGVSRSWACRMHLRALASARRLLEERGLPRNAFFSAT